MAEIELTGKLLQVKGVTTPALLQTDAATALGVMIEAYASQSNQQAALAVQYAYVDPYKLIGEIADKRDPNGPNFVATSATTKILDTLKNNGQPTIDELKASLAELNLNANANNGQGIWKYQEFTQPTAMYRGKATTLHPTIALDSWIFGWPNIPDSDPRRSGMVVVFNVASPPQADWLMQNSYKYGFIYYTGPCDTFLYVGVANINQNGQLAEVCGWGSRAVLAKRCKNMGQAINEENLKKASEDLSSPAGGIWSMDEIAIATKRNQSSYLWKWTIDNKVNFAPQGSFFSY